MDWPTTIAVVIIVCFAYYLGKVNGSLDGYRAAKRLDADDTEKVMAYINSKRS